MTRRKVSLSFRGGYRGVKNQCRHDSVNGCRGSIVRLIVCIQYFPGWIFNELHFCRSELLALNIYNTFYGRTGWAGAGQAKAVVFCIIVVAIALIQLRATRTKEVQQ